MAQYILSPTAYKTRSGYDSYDANHPVSNAFDADVDTYWTIGGTASTFDWYSQKCFYGFDLSQIPNSETITGAQIRLTYSKTGLSDSVACCFAKELSPNYLSYNALGDIMRLAEPAGADAERHTSVSVPKAVAYLNSYRSQIISGEKNFGVNFEAGYRYIRLHEAEIVITTEDTTKIFLGETPVTKAYLGTTPLTGIYLGNTKLL